MTRAGGSPPATADTTTTSAPAQGEVPLEQAAPALIAFVERERQSRFAPVPQIVGQLDSTFEAAAAVVADRNVALFRHQVTYEALGVTGGDLRAELRFLTARASVAVYDINSATVLVRGDMTTPYIRAQIVAVLTWRAGSPAAEAARPADRASTTPRSRRRRWPQGAPRPSRPPTCRSSIRSTRRPTPRTSGRSRGCAA